jgi:hypothetical protein
MAASKYIAAWCCLENVAFLNCYKKDDRFVPLLE